MSLSVEELEATFSLATNAIHMDDRYAGPDVAPAMHPSTTFRYPHDPEKLEPQRTLSKTDMVYARLARPTGSRLELVLTKLLRGDALVYATGLSAIHAYLVRLGPKRVAIGGGYHGTHAVLDIHHRLTGLVKVGLDELDQLEPGDVVHLETPLNPTGEARNISAYSQIAKEKGLYLVVDSTFGPPALQDPFVWGADIVIHSGTKFIGGHSDIMCGILTVKREDLFMGLWEDRCALGNLLGGFESWLGLRSLRTLDVRCRTQSNNCTAIVTWMTEKIKDNKPNEVNSTVENITHASLQSSDMEWLTKQMPNGFGPVFSLTMKTEKYAQWLPSKLRIFQHATSLGGVESLIEWRKMSDHSAPGDILRISVGIESLEDLQKDLSNGFKALLEG
ncbi:Cys/Met metabolism PLP-dependent enzyme-domain-containing protein [Fusarium redolens]|uniref:Cys/Met metabolism PLP-dependent enzyme-domain-containing protein n=1 Tax=Fusarium redolens TaxID=48865 RepID=A0A9P9FW21_FUSRE|nr:Cys/Met metabolism PLP-dependent enzyme-domain-containing protein [Fusarium redolens]KAH7205447.1 Cys/Met metabolism PLP-dependent enzyme-domain-containing protein [Fusarium redolens]